MRSREKADVSCRRQRRTGTADDQDRGR